MHSLQNYGSATSQYDGNAYSIASTYVDGQLKMYATHPAAPTRPGESSQYTMTQLDSYALTGNINNFRQGAGAYRNRRDWAQAQRDRFITSANEVAWSKSGETTSNSAPENGRASLSTAAEVISWSRIHPPMSSLLTGIRPANVGVTFLLVS
jgi:hypothetical protein